MKMTRWLKNLLGAVVIILLLWYLARHWDSLRGFVHLSPATIVYLYLVSTVGGVVGSYTIQHLLASFGIKPKFWEMFNLNNTTTLLNYLPAKFGTIYRANYLKRHYGLIYAHFGVIFLYLVLLMTMAASLIGLIVLITVYGLSKSETLLLAMIFAVTLVLFAFISFMPLPKRFLAADGRSGKFSSALRNFAVGRAQMTANKPALFVNMLLTAGCFLISSVRLGNIYHSMGQNVHPAGYLVLGAVAYVTMFIGITPGSLGPRELAGAFGSVALGVDFNVGLLAFAIDRAVAMVWCFTIGLVSAVYMWYKSPQDFKTAVPPAQNPE